MQIAATDEQAGEQDFQTKRKNEKTKNAKNIIIIAVATPILVLVLSFLSFWQAGFTVALLPFIYGTLTLVGVFTSVLLLFFEIDQYNPALQK